MIFTYRNNQSETKVIQHEQSISNLQNKNRIEIMNKIKATENNILSTRKDIDILKKNEDILRKVFCTKMDLIEKELINVKTNDEFISKKINEETSKILNEDKITELIHKKHFENNNTLNEEQITELIKKNALNEEHITELIKKNVLNEECINELLKEYVLKEERIIELIDNKISIMEEKLMKDIETILVKQSIDINKNLIEFVKLNAADLIFSNRHFCDKFEIWIKKKIRDELK